MSKRAETSDGYCVVCDEPTDEMAPSALCAYHRDHPKEVVHT